MHEVFRAIAYGDGQHYDPSSSPIANVLDITQDDGREHFLLPGLISRASQLADSAGATGYVEADELLRDAVGWGFTQEQIGGQLERAFSTNLFEGNDESGDPGLCRVTTIGAYTLRRLLPSFVYLDAVVVDTPIVDVAARADIGDVWSIEDRLDRAERFCAYLDTQWNELAASSIPLDWPTIAVGQATEINDVRRRASRY
jgi:hypothetical protein